MAKFCGFCGSQLEEGALCNCPEAIKERQKAQAAVSPPPVYPSAPSPAAYVSPPPAPVYQSAPGAGMSVNVNIDVSKASEFLKTLLVTFLGFFVSPFQTARDVRDNCSYLRSFFLIGIQALLLGALACTVIGRGLGAASDYLGINYFQMFIYTFLLTAAYSIILAAAVFLFSKVFKISGSFAKFLASVAAGAVPMSIAALVLLLMSVIFGVALFSNTLLFSLTACVFLTATGIAGCLLFALINENSDGANKSIFTLILASMCAIFVFLFVVISIVSQSMMASLSNFL
jgi:hypothetical protein